MKLIADNNTNITNQLEFLESLVTWPASFKKNIPANKNGCRALSIDFVGRAALEIQILYTWVDCKISGNYAVLCWAIICESDSDYWLPTSDSGEL